MKTRSFGLSLAIAVSVWTTPARADDVNGAAKAFSQAQQVMLGGDVARAADLYELADELAPSAPALRNAARARMQAGHLAAAATDAAALLRRYPSDKESREIAEAILSKLSPQLSQLEVSCSPACTILIDGKVAVSAAREQHSLFTQPGARTISGAFDDGRKAARQITAMPGRITTIQLEAPAKPVPRPASAAEPAGARAELRTTQSSAATGEASARPHGLSRWWVASAGAVTVGLGVATVVSGLATLSTRDNIRNSVAAGQTAMAMDQYNTGRDQQTRTNVLLGCTIAGAAGTVVLALFTNWHGEPRERELAIVPARDGLSFVYGRAF